MATYRAKKFFYYLIKISFLVHNINPLDIHLQPVKSNKNSATPFFTFYFNIIILTLTYGVFFTDHVFLNSYACYIINDVYNARRHPVVQEAHNRIKN
jgi:hypothetical protein